jgi:hypothetical protein
MVRGQKRRRVQQRREEADNSNDEETMAYSDNDELAGSSSSNSSSISDWEMDLMTNDDMMDRYFNSDDEGDFGGFQLNSGIGPDDESSDGEQGEDQETAEQQDGGIISDGSDLDIGPDDESSDGEQGEDQETAEQQDVNGHDGWTDVFNDINIEEFTQNTGPVLPDDFDV